MTGRRRRLGLEDLPRAGLAGWAEQLGPPGPEEPWSRRMARVGGAAAALALCLYLLWRVLFTLPAGGQDLTAAGLLLGFEALPLAGVVVNAVMLWNIDSRAPAPVRPEECTVRVAVLIPTYNEPLEVLAPTVAAACRLEPAHQTWVLDDGDRDWVEQMCLAYGARYVRRDVHDHAKAGNLNHALGLMADEEAAGLGGIDVVAVLDCDHVPLPGFLASTLGWFEDPGIALVQCPQNFYNSGAFDDDGITGEQGLFFNVQMRARDAAGAGPFWCGSTALLRVQALREVGGVATETITEDMHTTLKLIRGGWRTVYHHQALALGLAPATPEQYLLQRRRWGLGAMQILVREHLWAPKRWMSWRDYREYLNGTLWWLEGIATLVGFMVPAAVLLSGARTSTADPVAFGAVFALTFSVRLWGAKRLMRRQIHWPTAFALRVFRIPIGLACLWWLVTRRTLAFEVTPKGAADRRSKGRPPRILLALLVLAGALVLYAAAGTAGWVPWRATTASTAAAGTWLLLGFAVLGLGLGRIRSERYATSRRNAHRIVVEAPLSLDGVQGSLLDISVGGISARAPAGTVPPAGTVLVGLPRAEAVPLEVVRAFSPAQGFQTVSLKVREGDWEGYRALSLWLFHTPPGAIPHLPPGVPAVASARRAPGPALRMPEPALRLPQP